MQSPKILFAEAHTFYDYFPLAMAGQGEISLMFKLQVYLKV